VKVCRHCAEELPDDATVCSTCGKDPAVLPAWAVPKRPDEVLPPWQPNRIPDPSDDIPGPYEGLEPDVAQKPLLPPAVTVSLFLALFGGIFTFGLTGITGLILALAAPAIGLILGIVGRSQIKASNWPRDRLIWANIAIALHFVSLVMMFWVVRGLPTSVAH
jgi:hypothetical protein